MAVTTTKTNKPLNPRGNDQSPKGYNRAELYSGKALDFDGTNDTLSTDYAPSSNIQTTAYWVKIDNLSANLTLGGFVKGTTDQFGLYYWGTNANKYIGFNTWNSDSYGIKLPDFVDDWFHIVAEYNFSDFTQSKLFVNGQELSISQVFGTTLQRTTASRTFKIDTPTSTQEMNGKINGVKVFEGSLTAAQVADLYNNPEKIVPTGVADSALKLWLPMQEGAGTTAYDGSGNGNHGTISGATWTHGIGAPVSQTAVIDWNKGTNETAYSEEFDSWLTKDHGVSVVDNDATAPDGQETASTITFAANQVNSRVQDFKAGSLGLKTQIVSVWARATSGTETFRFKCSHGGVIDYFSNDLTATTEWQRFSFSQTFGSSAGTGVFYGLYNGTDLAARSLEFWGFQLQTDAAALTPYIPTLSTAQTSDVLLPQGLTTGRDITGVNLFENVRKQGALNLDGNSWAEVHKNDSIPEGDEGRTLECWFFGVDRGATQSYMETGNNSGTNKRFGILTLSSDNIYIVGQGYDTDTGVAMDLDAWNHVAVTHDGSTLKVYKNGSLIKTVTGRTYATANDDVVLGRNGSTGGEDCFGAIAQPRIYNRALTAEEVQRNYDAGKNIYTND